MSHLHPHIQQAIAALDPADSRSAFGCVRGVLFSLALDLGIEPWFLAQVAGLDASTAHALFASGRALVPLPSWFIEETKTLALAHASGAFDDLAFDGVDDLGLRAHADDVRAALCQRMSSAASSTSLGARPS